MNRPYGPWATLITAGQNPQLLAFWRRRMRMLASVSKASTSLTRRSVLLLVAGALFVFLLPTFRARRRPHNSDLRQRTTVRKRRQNDGKAAVNAPRAGRESAPGKIVQSNDGFRSIICTRAG